MNKTTEVRSDLEQLACFCNNVSIAKVREAISAGARDLGAEGGVECWVCDNGAGIPEKLLERVFDQGETDPESTGGTGLGLAIVKTLTEAHGGKVTVESKEGVGSMFRFSLPTKANVNSPG